jgi:hypothetical protein
VQFRAPLPIHPVLLAATPPLFLFAQNAIQQISLDPLWLPLAVSIAVGAAIAGILTLAYRDWQRGALAASLLIVAFFSFGHAANLLGADSTTRLWLAGVYTVIVLGGLLAIRRAGRWLAGATRFANLVSVVLAVINTLTVIGFAIGVSRVGIPGAATPIPVAPAVDHRPDVYYIILDRYAGAETLADVYGFDNRPFLEALEARGFSIADDAWANYPKTAYSLVSSLNADRLDPDAMGWTDPSSFTPINLALRGSLRVPATFKAMGYQYVHIANYWDPSATNADADSALSYGATSEFAAALLSTTAWSVIQPPSARDLDPETTELPSLARDTTLFEFRALRDVAARHGPKYVFAHFLLPHPPYVFDTDGSEPTAQETAARTAEEAYIAQLQWANSQLLEVVDRLMDVPAVQRPIVILQGDEGPFPARFAANQEDFDWTQATPTEVSQKFGILMAVSLPDAVPEEHGFTERTSPANVFRVVLDAEFGAHEPMLPDDVFLVRDYRHLNTLIPYDRGR